MTTTAAAPSPKSALATRFSFVFVPGTNASEHSSTTTTRTTASGLERAKSAASPSEAPPAPQPSPQTGQRRTEPGSGRSLISRASRLGVAIPVEVTTMTCVTSSGRRPARASALRAACTFSTRAVSMNFSLRCVKFSSPTYSWSGSAKWRERTPAVSKTFSIVWSARSEPIQRSHRIFLSASCETGSPGEAVATERRMALGSCIGEVLGATAHPLLEQRRALDVGYPTSGGAGPNSSDYDRFMRRR